MKKTQSRQRTDSNLDLDQGLVHPSGATSAQATFHSTSDFTNPRAAPEHVGLKGRTKMKQAARMGRCLGILALAALIQVPAQAVDADAAKQLAKQNNCFKCHAVEKDKDGPAWKKVAEKYKGKADAEARLTTHLTSGEKAKFPDGHEEEHKIVKTDPPKDAAQVKNLVDWILSL
jgi:cytochrome c